MVSAKEPSVFLFYHPIVTYCACLGARSCRFRVLVLSCLHVVFFYYKVGFTLSLTANCFSAEPWIELWINPSWVAGKQIFVMQFTIFGLYWPLKQKVPKTWIKNGPVFGITTLTYPPWLPISFHCLRTEVLAPEKHCTQIVSVMWPENLELVFRGSLFHWSQSILSWYITPCIGSRCKRSRITTANNFGHTSLWRVPGLLQSTLYSLKIKAMK